jgi:hypothetical protein
MPTLTVTHEAPLELIRQCPGVAVDLVRAMTGVPLPADPKASLGPTSLNAVVPAEFTADAVVVVTDRATEAPALVIVVEPQGRDDKTKAYSWPAYLAIVREAVKCLSAVLLVVCPDPREADKCRKVIRWAIPAGTCTPSSSTPRTPPTRRRRRTVPDPVPACLPARHPRGQRPPGARGDPRHRRLPCRAQAAHRNYPEEGNRRRPRDPGLGRVQRRQFSVSHALRR